MAIAMGSLGIVLAHAYFIDSFILGGLMYVFYSKESI